MKESIRFIHTTDWQIGKPYRQIADDQKRFKMQQERLNAIGRIRDAARMQAAAFVVVAGDLFDSPTPPTTAVLEEFSVLRFLVVLREDLLLLET